MRGSLAAHWLGIRVVGTFVGLITVFFFMMTYEPIAQRVDIAAALAQISAWLSWVILRGVGLILGIEITKNGTILGSGAFEVDVSPACSGAVPTMIYLSAVFAFPAPLRSKLIGVALGVTVINGLNLIRIIALFLIGLYFVQLFHETHVYIAQALVVAVAVATWLFWAGRYVDVARR